MIALSTVRAVLAGGALLSALAFGGVAPASAASTGMAAEFPVGACIDYRNDHLALDGNDLRYVTVVSCSDPGRDYRVTAQVAHAPQCDATTSRIYTTRDLVVLCVVQDAPASAPPVFGG
ncbi:hypothetical protein [Mycolicibacterium sp.]|uniref:hypothetical protein n=1 Tax=Mycolicibacterium sp. TaxID=2320850 RepID=UPI001A1EDD04|nr:hypothetical protein [Mycolicibacterium sp.]MBJ7337862.1 hypothetical protein [Mycolicibacterium sp.]